MSSTRTPQSASRRSTLPALPARLAASRAALERADTELAAAYGTACAENPAAGLVILPQLEQVREAARALGQLAAVLEVET